jgi:signal transduction histidine kinase
MRCSQSLDRRERFSDLLSVLSTRFARIHHVEIDAEIEHWLERVGRSLNLDRSVIGEYLRNSSDFQVTHQWTREGFPIAPKVLASEVIPWILTRVRSGEIAVIPGVSFLPPEAERDRNFMLHPLGPKATVVMPLIIAGKVVGGITFADLHGERRWPSALVRKLGLVADIFANALERKRSAMEASRSREETQQAARFTLMGEMTAAMAHELSHPLGAILANAQAARRLLESPRPNLGELREILEDVISGERRAAAYVEKVRSLFRKSELHIVPLKVDRVLDATTSLMRSDMLRRGISLQIEIESGLPMIRADRVGIEQVIINLVRNAADAICESECSARRVTLHASRRDPLWVRIAISDTGKGIDKKDLDKIFQPLFTSKAKGMGMGLAIVRSIVESHGGEIYVRSDAGAGATFEFTVPVAGEN